MFATCLFCQRDLGRNETFETFPIGRRLAFDPARGRLWVVCPQCERWNLSPLEERWEAIEQAERLYRDTRRRVATDNIGLAKLRDGTTLVRIGEPLRPEFAAWRYGDQFGRRRRRQMLLVGGGLGVLGAIIAGGAAVGVGIGGFGWLIARAGAGIVRGNPESVVARIKAPNGDVLRVRRRHLLETSIEPGENAPLAVDLRFAGGSRRFEGEQAMHVASRIVPAANRFGGSKQTVAEAVGVIEEAGSPEGFLDKLAQAGRVTTRARRSGAVAVPGSVVQFTGWGGVVVGRRGAWRRRDWSTGLFALNQVQRLALEMALHEEAERAAMQGELASLELAWREAEEIAGIADSLLVPPEVDAAWKDLKDDAARR
jgi:hypothetical protein